MKPISFFLFAALGLSACMSPQGASQMSLAAPATQSELQFYNRALYVKAPSAGTFARSAPYVAATVRATPQDFGTFTAAGQGPGYPF